MKDEMMKSGNCPILAFHAPRWLSRWMLLFLASALVGHSSLCADEIIVTGGRNYEGVTIMSASWEQVEYRLPGVSKSQKVSSDKVLELHFSGEPTTLSRGRGALEQGDLAGAVNSLKSASSQGSDRHRANASYLHAVALLRQGQQDASKIPLAMAAFDAFLAQHESKKDFYVPLARLGLSTAYKISGKWSEAEQSLLPLARGDMGKRWILGGTLGRAEVLLAQDNWTEARELFSSVANDSEAGASVGADAWLGYASCQLGQKQWSSATDTVRQKVLENRDRNAIVSTAARAKAWLIWGRASQGQAAGDRTQLQWAMIRYFRAAVVATAGDGEILAESLFRAKSAAKELGMNDRVDELSQRLQKLVPNSVWNQ
ncbi:MAG: hypothetical protein OSB09_02920 [Planctomycetota bacterium]|nr:hypothetical protein [Planctomycetota bacterium]